MLENVYACVLAGGQSSRFGSDKARALLNGVPLIMHAIAPAQSLGIPFFAVADEQGKYDDLGIETIRDTRPGGGPLVGLETALKDIPENASVLLLACDQVGARPEWITQLLTTSEDTNHITRFDVQPLQPFLARYHARLLPVVSKALDQDHRAMHMFINDQPQTLLPPPPDWHRLRNINTSDDLHQHA